MDRDTFWRIESQEGDSHMNVIQTQIKRAIGSAINDRFIHQIHSEVENILMRENNSKTGSSSCSQNLSDQPD